MLGGDPPDGYCCLRYASYWNAFLLVKISENPMKVKEILVRGVGGDFSIDPALERIKNNGIYSFNSKDDALAASGFWYWPESSKVDILSK